jgi:Zn-dependent protease with chaperone function
VDDGPVDRRVSGGVAGAGPLLDLPPVPLPPPGGDEGRTRSLAGRAALSIALLVGAVLLAVGVLAAVVGINLLLFQAGRIQIYLLIFAFAVVVSLGRGLVAALRKPDDPPDEVEVPPAAEPELHAEIARLAAAAGTRPPDRIVVVPEVNAYVREFGPMFGLLPGTRTLGIGTPLLDVLDVSELRSVLAHELGHLAGGDTRLGPVTLRTDQALRSIIASLGGGFVARLFHAYWKFQHKVNASVRRGQEVVADRASVRVAGRQAAADALRDVEVAARADQVFRYQYLAPLLQRGRRPEHLADGWRGVLGDRVRVAELVEQAEADESPIDPWASHPPTHERIRRIAALADEAVVGRDTRAASSLLRQPEAWVQAADARWLQLAGVPESRPVVPWSEWGEVVAAAEQAERAGDTDRALARIGLPAGLDGVHAALAGGRDRDLAAALVAAGWRAAPGADPRVPLLRAALVAAAAQEAVRGGAQWATSWSSPVAVAQGGAAVPLRPLVDAALAGDWAPLQAAVRPGPAPQVAEVPSAPVAPDAAPTAAVAGAAEQGLPTPPSPPFTNEIDPPYRWAVNLPGRWSRNVVLAVGDEAVGLGDGACHLSQVAHLTTKVAVQSGGNIGATIVLQPHGDAAPLEARVSGAGDRADTVLAAVGYLWEVLNWSVGPQARAAVHAEIVAGRTAHVGGLALSPGGVALSRKPKPVVPWSQVGAPYYEDLQVRVPAGEWVLSVSIGEPDAFLLRDMLPELAARLG